MRRPKPATRTRRPTPAQRAREASGLSLAEAARRAQVTPEHYRRLERRNEFSFGQARFLGALFGVSPWQLHPLALVHERGNER